MASMDESVSGLLIRRTERGNGVILVNSVADLDSDGDVDSSDFAALAARWMEQYCIGPDWCNGCDLNKNGVVNIEDLAQWAQAWLLNKNL